MLKKIDWESICNNIIIYSNIAGNSHKFKNNLMSLHALGMIILFLLMFLKSFLESLSYDFYSSSSCFYSTFFSSLNSRREDLAVSSSN